MPSTFTHHFNTAAYKGTVAVPLGLYINGEFVDPVENGTLDVHNPSTGKIVTSIAAGTKADIDIAARAAKKAFKTSWGLKVPGAQRGKLMAKLAELMEKHIEEFAALDALTNGKAFKTAYGRDLKGAISVMQYYAGWADKITGKTIETNENKMAYTRHEPIGVVGQIIPWNIAPALATGNTIVLKPSELTPLSALLFCTLIAEAGFPPGVINIVNGYGATAGQAISESLIIEKVAFTGSTLTGRKIMEAAAKSNLKPVTLELGGKSPNVIFDDADLDQAVKWAIHGIYFNHGQNCSAGSRIFIQAGIYDEFLRQFTEQALALKVGDPFDPSTFQGPQVSKTQFERIMGYISSGKSDGATVHIGGNRIGEEGYFIQPTIFTDCTSNMKIVREEIFGPVACVMKFTTEEEAIEQANDTSYGLAASVFTKDIDRAIRFAHALEAGTAWSPLINLVQINCANQTEISLPFGGFKQSGIGRELSEYALENYTNVKAVHVNIGIRL
ncbi:putative 1-pyrroline-5-carboxylate dehydrogenase [Serpula lacrymans var. lacrymans S7.9]|uniref:Putative 1-pyrroline-5-carboxylate dehydrogenase n=1 Tax=Serpula lacrymans var. lacrymans (strain S7.9) TaxID=578457 RepID=F8PA11_SERL9|nr:putative 1-pyrroline-5-carboxylate dehydrogenase [Serpula lacrymans var. lacrymans S7.9]EGO20009.1 putative 1-pyrroline-5-carboxylate dehydrogenase [Serpula lacrymans var. lacrymans S7.9]